MPPIETAIKLNSSFSFGMPITFLAENWMFKKHVWTKTDKAKAKPIMLETIS